MVSLSSLSISRNWKGWEYFNNTWRPDPEGAGAIGSPNADFWAGFKDINVAPENWQYATIIYCTIGWFVLRYLSVILCNRYFKLFRKGDSRFQKVWMNRWVSTIHAVLITIATLYMVVIDDGFGMGWRLWAEALHTNSIVCQVIMLFATSYMIYDSIDILFFPNSETLPMLLHHIIGATAFWLACTAHRCNYFGPLLLLMEATTPFLNFRWWLSKYNMKDTKIYLINGYIFTFGFFIFRICNSLFIYYNFEIVNKEGQKGGEYSLYIVLHGLLAALFGLNIFWFYKVVRGALAALDSRKKRGVDEKKE